MNSPFAGNLLAWSTALLDASWDNQAARLFDQIWADAKWANHMVILNLHPFHTRAGSESDSHSVYIDSNPLLILNADSPFGTIALSRFCSQLQIMTGCWSLWS